MSFLSILRFAHRRIIGSSLTSRASARGSRTRRIGIEVLEGRRLLSISPNENPWHNTAQPTDVNHDGYTSPLDALMIFNQLDQGHGGALPNLNSLAATKSAGIAASSSSPIYPDVNSDGVLSVVDALNVFNYLDAHPADSKTATAETLTANAAIVAVTIQSVTNPVTAANQTNTTVSGIGPLGATIQVGASDPGFAHFVGPFSTTVLPDGTWSVSGIDVSTLNDGPINYGALNAADENDLSILDSYKAVATSITTVTDPVNLSNATAAAVTGTGVTGNQISVVASDFAHATAPRTVTVAPNGTWSVANLDVSGLDDGTIFYTATIVGTTAQFSVAAVKDTVAPAVSITAVTDPITVLNAGSTSISGTGEVGALVTIVAGDGLHATAPVSLTIDVSGLWALNGLDVTTLDDGVITYTATATDDFGNSASSTKTATKVAAPAPTIAVSDVSIVEGNLGTKVLLFNVKLSASSSEPVTVDYSTLPGTATAGTDYQGGAGTLVFAPGEIDKTISVTVFGDTTYETDETLSILLSTPANTGRVNYQAIGTILNDDAAPTILLADAESIVEGDAGDKQMLFAVTLSAASEVPVTFDFGPADFSFAPPAVNGDDYALTDGAFTFLPGQTQLTLPVTIHADQVNEDDEFVTVRINNVTGATPATAFSAGTILNDDLSALSINDAQIVEGDSGAKAMQFTVTLSKPSDAQITVDYATADGSALADHDYTAASGTLTFDPQQTTKTFTINVQGDTLAENQETLQVLLSNVVGRNASIADATGVGTIIDNDALPAVSISIRNAPTTAEGNSGVTPMNFTVELSAPSESPISVQYTTAAGTATAGVDYKSASGTLTFAPGEISKSITVDVIGDTGVESDETVFVTLQNPTHAVLASSQAVGTIRNDDQPASGSNFALGGGWIAYLDKIVKDGYFSDDPVFASGSNLNTIKTKDGTTISVGGSSFAFGF